MNLTIDRDALASLLKTCSPAAAGRTTNPVLRCVKLAAADGTLTAAATDCELYVTGRATADVSRAGSLCVPADVLGEAVRLAPAGPVTLANDKRAELKYKGGSYKLNTEDAARFPEWVPPEKEGVTFAVPAADLLRLFSRVAFCCMDRAERYATAGVLLDAAGGELSAVATDTTRMAIAACPVGPVECKALVPQNTVRAALTALAGVPDGTPVAVTVWNSCVRLAAPEVTVSSPLLSGEFAPWRIVLGKQKPDGLTLTDDPAALLKAVRRAVVTAKEEDAGVFVAADGADLTLTAAGKSGDGEVTHTCQSAAGVGSKAKTKCDPKKLTDWLALAAAEGAGPVGFSPGDGVKALWLTCEGWRYFVMPMFQNN